MAWAVAYAVAWHGCTILALVIANNFFLHKNNINLSIFVVKHVTFKAAFYRKYFVSISINKN